MVFVTHKGLHGIYFSEFCKRLGKRTIRYASVFLFLTENFYSIRKASKARRDPRKTLIILLSDRNCAIWASRRPSKTLVKYLSWGYLRSQPVVKVILLPRNEAITQFRYNKIQPKNNRPRHEAPENKPHELCSYSVVNTSKLVYWFDVYCLAF